MNEIPNLILQSKLPEGQTEVAAARLPSMRPVVGPWLTCDDAYDAQMVLRRKLLHDCEPDVYAQTPSGLAAACGFVDAVLDALPDGFVRTEDHVQCPDGYKVLIDWLAPLRSIGAVLQQDVCILERRGDEHGGLREEDAEGDWEEIRVPHQLVHGREQTRDDRQGQDEDEDQEGADKWYSWVQELGLREGARERICDRHRRGE